MKPASAVEYISSITGVPRGQTCVEVCPSLTSGLAADLPVFLPGSCVGWLASEIGCRRFDSGSKAT